MHDSAALTGRCLRHRVQIIMYRPCIESTSLCSPEGRTTFFQQIFPHVVFGWWWWGPVRRVTSLCQCWVWFWFWYWSRAVYSLSLTSVPDLDDFISRLFFHVWFVMVHFVEACWSEPENQNRFSVCHLVLVVLAEGGAAAVWVWEIGECCFNVEIGLKLQTRWCDWRLTRLNSCNFICFAQSV